MGGYHPFQGREKRVERRRKDRCLQAIPDGDQLWVQLQGGANQRNQGSSCCCCSCSGSLQGGRRFLEAKKNEEKFESFYERGGEGKGKNKAEKRSKKELFGEKMEGREENRSQKRKR